MKVMLPRCWHRLFLTLLSHTRTINNYPRIGDEWETLRTQRWGSIFPSCTTETKTDCKRRAREKKKRIHIDCIASFPGQRNMTQRHLTEPAVPPVRKESTSETTMIPLALWVALWQPLLWFHTKKIAKEPARFNSWESDCGKWGGACRDLGRQIHIHSV